MIGNNELCTENNFKAENGIKCSLKRVEENMDAEKLNVGVQKVFGRAADVRVLFEEGFQSERMGRKGLTVGSWLVCFDAMTVDASAELPLSLRR